MSVPPKIGGVERRRLVGNPNVEDARKAFDPLAVGGTATMPLDKSWAAAFGMLVDKPRTWGQSCSSVNIFTSSAVHSP